MKLSSGKLLLLIFLLNKMIFVTIFLNSTVAFSLPKSQTIFHCHLLNPNQCKKSNVWPCECLGLICQLSTDRSFCKKAIWTLDDIVQYLIKIISTQCILLSGKSDSRKMRTEIDSLIVLPWQESSINKIIDFNKFAVWVCVDTMCHNLYYIQCFKSFCCC